MRRDVTLDTGTEEKDVSKLLLRQHNERPSESCSRRRHRGLYRISEAFQILPRSAKYSWSVSF